MMKKPASKMCDVYSYGILLWEMTTHDQPFNKLASTLLIPHEVLSGQVNTELYEMITLSNFLSPRS